MTPRSGIQPTNSIAGPVPDHSIPISNRFDHSPVVGFGIAPATAAVSVSSTSTPDATGLFKAFQRRWRLAVALGVLAGIIAASGVWSFLPPPKYTAESLLLVEPEQPRLIVSTKEHRLDPETDRRTQIALIKSLVMSKVATLPEVAALEIMREQGDQVEWLESEVKAEFSGKILRLSLSCTNPTDAATLIRSVTQTYITEVANKEKAQRIERNRTLELHYNKLQKQLEAKRIRLKSLSSDLGSKDKQTLSLQQRLAMSRQAISEEELLRTQSELRRAMAELKVAQTRAQPADKGDPSTSSSSPGVAKPEQDITQHPLVQEYLRQEERIIGSIENASRVARRSTDPAIQYAKRELAKVQKQRKKLEAQLRSEMQAPIANTPDAVDQAEASLTSLKDQVEVLAGLERDLRDEVEKFNDHTKTLESKALEVGSILDDVKSAEEIAQLIGSEIEALKIELLAPDRVTILKDAKVPRAKDKSRQIKLSGIAAGGAFGAIILLISFCEFRARRISSTDEVIGGLGIKVVGTVPFTRGNTSNSIASTSASRDPSWQHHLVESIDTTRIMLTRIANSESLRVILVTSAVGGEGKSSLSTYLASSLARSGKKTLLIDGDFRRPTLHRIFDQPPEPGFCELIGGRYSAPEVIRPTEMKHLWILTAGIQDDQTLSLLSQNDVRNQLDRLREQFDFIIVDSAPVLPVADSLLLAQLVDATLFSILRDVSQLHKVQAAYERLKALGVPMLGAVLSGTNMTIVHRYGY